MNIQNNLNNILQLIAKYEQKYQRNPGSVRLLAASKGQSSQKILQAFAAGQRLFGENYVQEALKKIATLPPEIEWHFIGPLQTNKTKKIAEHFSWVHSVDEFKKAKRLNDQRPDELGQLNICIEINISGEASKFGVSADSVFALAESCLSLPRLNLRGLMAIPAPKQDFNQQREIFHKVYLIWQQFLEQGLDLDTLSLGMSHDFEAAIAEGSTMVRVGQAIFGARTQRS